MAQIVKHCVLTFVERYHQPGVTEWAETLASLLSTQGTTQSLPSWNSSGWTFETLKLIEASEPTKRQSAFVLRQGNVPVLLHFTNEGWSCSPSVPGAQRGVVGNKGNFTVWGHSSLPRDFYGWLSSHWGVCYSFRFHSFGSGWGKKKRERVLSCILLNCIKYSNVWPLRHDLSPLHSSLLSFTHLGSLTNLLEISVCHPEFNL